MLGALVLAGGGTPAPVAWGSTLLVVAALAELSWIVRQRPQPLSVRRQVPRLWARVFPLAGATILYGLRLGVGPFTILRSWFWWAGAVLAASTGAWSSAAAGALFGVVRISIQLLAVLGADAAMPERMREVQRLERSISVPVALALLLFGIVLIGVELQ